MTSTETAEKSHAKTTATISPENNSMHDFIGKTYWQRMLDYPPQITTKTDTAYTIFSQKTTVHENSNPEVFRTFGALPEFQKDFFHSHIFPDAIHTYRNETYETAQTEEYKNKFSMYGLAVGIFVGGICFDLIITFIGLSLGFQEGNPLGLEMVMILNTILLVYVVLKYKTFREHIKQKKTGYKMMIPSLIILGGYRFFVGTLNVLLIVLHLRLI